MPIDPEIPRVLRRHLKDPSSSFSIGSLGAIAEFHRDLDEVLEICDLERLTIATSRGALRIDLIEEIKPLAYETLSARKGCWQHGVVFCLTTTKALGHRRSVLTELGQDRAAVRGVDRDAVLFDLGLAARNVDFCIRTKDSELLSLLRQGAGRSVLKSNSPILATIVQASPHRVAIAKLGRLEVYQAIGKTKTPSGPHTHLLLDLLATDRTHSSNIPVAEGYIPSLSVYPANPLFDNLGCAKPFERASLAAFEALLVRWGIPEYCAEKARVVASVRDGSDPTAFQSPGTRLGRTALRVALRQLQQTKAQDPIVGRWLEHFDRPSREIEEFSDDM